jgi:hypothetical protein
MKVLCVLCKQWFDIDKMSGYIRYCPEHRNENKSNATEAANRGFSTGWQGMEEYRKQCIKTEKLTRKESNEQINNEGISSTSRSKQGNNL